MSWTARLPGRLMRRARRIRHRWKAGRQREAGFVFLRDQQPLSSREWQIACRARAAVNASIAGREGYIERHGLERDVHLPSAIWQFDAGGGLYDGFRLITEGDYATVNHLRLFTQAFTGYRLASMEYAEGRPFPRERPDYLDQKLERLASRPNAFVSRYAEMLEYIPPELHITFPKMFGEIGWNVDGKIVNHDLYVYLERIVLLYEQDVLARLNCRKEPGAPVGNALRGVPRRPNSIRTPGDFAERHGGRSLQQVDPLTTGNNGTRSRPVRILEIGGGFGGLAHHLKTLVPNAQYYIVDIPESLTFSAIYLSVLHKDERNVCLAPDNPLPEADDTTTGFTFVPNYLFDRLAEAGLEFDLVINTLSMSEMSEAQVRYYCERLGGLLADDGVFFEQNHDNRDVRGLDARSIVEDYFAGKRELRSRILGPLSQGRAHLWTQPVPRFGEPVSHQAPEPVPDSVHNLLEPVTA